MYIPLISGQVSWQQRAFALQQLALLISAGYTLSDATLKLEPKAPAALRRALADLRESLGQTGLQRHKRVDLLGDYLRDFLATEPKPAQQAEALQAVARFTRRVGEESRRNRRLLRQMARPLWLFLAVFLFLAQVIQFQVGQLAGTFRELGMVLPVPVQVSLSLSMFFLSKLAYLLIFFFLVTKTLRWCRLRGWLLFSRGLIKATGNILVSEAMISICRAEGENTITPGKIGRLLPLLPELKSLLAKLEGMPGDLLLEDALEKIKGLPPELTVALQAGIDGGDLPLSLESFLALQLDRQKQAIIHFRRVEMLALIISISLLIMLYYWGIDQPIAVLLANIEPGQ